MCTFNLGTYSANPTGANKSWVHLVPANLRVADVSGNEVTSELMIASAGLVARTWKPQKSAGSHHRANISGLGSRDKDTSCPGPKLGAKHRRQISDDIEQKLCTNWSFFNVRLDDKETTNQSVPGCNNDAATTSRQITFVANL